MSSAALRSARSDAASGGPRFRDHVNHPDYEVLAYIDGDFRPASADWIPVLDKAAGVPFGRYTNCSAEQVDRAVAAARRAQPGWAATSSTTRQTILRAFAMELELRRDELIALIIRETGGAAEKAEEELGQSITQLMNSATQLTENAGDILPPYKPGQDLTLARGPARRHRPDRALELPDEPGHAGAGTRAGVRQRRGAQPGRADPDRGRPDPGRGGARGRSAGRRVQRASPATATGTGQALVRHPEVELVHFTGSGAVGRQIAGIAAASLRPAVLELGGDNAFVVLEDADIDRAASCAVWSALWFQGQTCITAGRHIVLRGAARAFTEAVADNRVSRLRVGDPLRESVDLGPVITERQLARFHDGMVLPSVTAGTGSRSAAPTTACSTRRPCSPMSLRTCRSSPRRSSGRSCRSQWWTPRTRR